MRKVLIYVGNSNIEQESIEKVFKKINVEYAYLSNRHLTMRMKELLELKDSLLVRENRPGFIYVDSNDVEEIQNLDKLLKEESADIERKAIVTENNIDWTLKELMDEVDEEYKYFKLKDRLYYLVSNPDRDKINKDTDYLKLMSMAYSLLETDQVEKELLEVAIKAIETYE